MPLSVVTSRKVVSSSLLLWGRKTTGEMDTVPLKSALWTRSPISRVSMVFSEPSSRTTVSLPWKHVPEEEQEKSFFLRNS